MESFFREKEMKHETKAVKMEITVYTAQSCPYCTMAKRYLSSKGIAFEEVDVSVDREKAMEMVSKSGQMGVPQIEINGRMIVGFNQPAIDAELSKLPMI